MTDQSGSGGAWHPDPLNRYSQRWWDGSAWTDQVVDATGQTITDPMGVTAAPAVDATIVDPVAETGTTSVFGAPPPPGQAAAGAPGAPGQAAAGAAGAGAGYAASPSGYYAPPAVATSSSNNLAIAALVLGILGLFCVPFAIGALICGLLGWSTAKKTGIGKGMSMAGIILGALGIVVTIVVTLILVVGANKAVDNLDDVNSDPSNGVCNPDRYLQDPDC